MTELGFTAGEAARQLGVAVTTLRSWHQRYGLGPTRHEPGRHRRYGADDLARLATMRTLIAQGMAAAEAARLTVAGVRVPAASAPAPAPELTSVDGRPARGARVERAVQGLLDTALRLDAQQLRRLVERALAERGVVGTWDELVSPVLATIGDQHAASGELIEVEHLLSRVVSEAFAVVDRPAPGVPVRVLLACADEEQHTLPLEALAAAAAEREVACRQLGARVPLAALLAAVQRTGPALVVLWSHAPNPAHPAQLREVLASTTRRPLLAAAGPGWPPDLPEGVVAPASLSDAVELVVAVAGSAAGPPG